jgi:hypothetical protein
MTITVTLKDEAAHIVERQVAEGRYPDAEKRGDRSTHAARRRGD